MSNFTIIGLLPKLTVVISVLNLGQFERFMSVIRKLGDRVEQEHKQHLRDTQRIEDRSDVSGSMPSPSMTFGGSLDFASLVAGASTKTVNPDVEQSGKSWEDDVWGSLLSSEPEVRRIPPFQSHQSNVVSLSATDYSAGLILEQVDHFVFTDYVSPFGPSNEFYHIRSCTAATTPACE